jgi:hypothetical protein
MSVALSQLASYKGGRGRVEDLHFLDPRKNKQVCIHRDEASLVSTHS